MMISWKKMKRIMFLRIYLQMNPAMYTLVTNTDNGKISI